MVHFNVYFSGVSTAITVITYYHFLLSLSFFAVIFVNNTHQVKKMPLWWAWEKNRLSIKGRWLKYFARSSTPSSLLLGVLQAYNQKEKKDK